MRKGKEYLLTLDSAPTITPRNGDQATIFDWSEHESFQVITILSSGAAWGTAAVNVRAIFDNAYNTTNFQDSRLRYRDANGTSESREIVNITELGTA
jgi:hypothetical protein